MSFLDEEYDFILENEPTLEELIASAKSGHEHIISMVRTDQTLKEATLAHFASEFKSGDNDAKNLKLAIMTFAASRASVGKKREVRKIDGVPFHVGFQFPAKTLKYELNKIRTVVQSIDSDSTKMFKDNVFPMLAPNRPMAFNVNTQPVYGADFELWKDGEPLIVRNPKGAVPPAPNAADYPVGVETAPPPRIEIVVKIGEPGTPSDYTSFLNRSLRVLARELSSAGVVPVRTTYWYKGKLVDPVLEGSVGVYGVQSGIEVATMRRSGEPPPVPHTLEYTKVLFEERTYVLPMFLSCHIREHWLFAYRTVNSTEQDLRRAKEYRDMVDKMDTASLRKEMDILKVSEDPYRNEYLEIMLKALSTRVGGHITAVVPKLPNETFGDPLLYHLEGICKRNEGKGRSYCCMSCGKMCRHLGCMSCVPSNDYNQNCNNYYNGACLVCIGVLKNQKATIPQYFVEGPDVLHKKN